MLSRIFLMAFLGSTILGTSLASGGMQANEWQFWAIAITYNVVWVWAVLDMSFNYDRQD